MTTLAPRPAQRPRALWHLLSDVVWLTSGGWIVIVIVVRLPAQQVLDATVVRDPRDAGKLVQRLIDVHGCPAACT